MDLNYERLPVHIRAGAQTYIERGIIPGDFLEAVISNDLKGAMGQADEINREGLFGIVGFFYNEAPSQCWGSPEKMGKWAKSGGLLGQEETAIASATAQAPTP